MTQALTDASPTLVENYQHYHLLTNCKSSYYWGMWHELSALPLGATLYPRRTLMCLERHGENPKFSVLEGERLIVRQILKQALAVEHPERPEWAGELHVLCCCALHFIECCTTGDEAQRQMCTDVFRMLNRLKKRWPGQEAFLSDVVTSMAGHFFKKESSPNG